MSRAYRWTDADHIGKEPSRPTGIPAAKVNHGACQSCGSDTTRSVTAGGEGHPRNGWECVKCGEHYLALELLGTDMETL